MDCAHTLLLSLLGAADRLSLNRPKHHLMTHPSSVPTVRSALGLASCNHPPSGVRAYHPAPSCKLSHDHTTSHEHRHPVIPCVSFLTSLHSRTYALLPTFAAMLPALTTEGVESLLLTPAASALGARVGEGRLPPLVLSLHACDALALLCLPSSKATAHLVKSVEGVGSDWVGSDWVNMRERV